MSNEAVLDKQYDPRKVEGDIYKKWEDSGAFRAPLSDNPDQPVPHDKTFTMVIPPPNVTGALHLGHALNNTLQDILIRYHRMRGFHTLWQPGTDHAGIATQAVVERRIMESEGKTRQELGRDELIKRIWEWKSEYETRIISQLKLMGCSCDWERKRFTLDEGMSKAVRHIFFKLFKDGLIFRGNRLVNWDTQLQTAVSDDEVYHEMVKGHFWHFKYPVIPDPKRPDEHRNEGARISDANRDEGTDEQRRDREGARNLDEPKYVIIATTRPETMLADTAVAVHPDPVGYFDQHESDLRETLASATDKDKAQIKAKLEMLTNRRETHLPLLVQLRDMAKDGRMLLLPLVEREIPLICDEWADPMKGSGCVKITPAHDPNDYEVGVRNKLPMINVLTPDGKIAKIIEPDSDAAPTKPGNAENAHSEKYQGLIFRGDGRQKVIADMESLDLVHEIEEREYEVGHSDRSKVPIEPFLSDQWFVKTEDNTDQGITLGDDTKAPGLAQAAMDVVNNGRVKVFPSRYAKSYLDWLGEKRDWCISRQLWWGHPVSIWHARLSGNPGSSTIAQIREWHFKKLTKLQAALDDIANQQGFDGAYKVVWQPTQLLGECFICASTEHANSVLETIGSDLKKDILQSRKHIEKVTHLLSTLSPDPDVLDTWFSSALWPFSTLGWPEDKPHVKQYYPGSVLCTSRDIITNWVARMVMFGLYAMGDIPFDHVYIHPKILDGRGETMSKSKGNGVDPVDVIHTHGADALRYSMADMCTETQDIRMPVEYVCPHCGKLTPQEAALKAETQARKSRGEKLTRKLQPSDCHRVTCTDKDCNKEFATQWADPTLKKELGLSRETSDKFDIGRNFCNKLWNAARFAFMNLEGVACEKLDIAALPPEDRWILAKLSQTIIRYHEAIANYQFSTSVRELREFFWDSLCDWYIELTKPRLSAEPQVLTCANIPEQQTLPCVDSPDSMNSKKDNRDPAKQVLAFCLDQILRLWHPTMPFITERLWKQLNLIAPQRGLPGVAELKCDTLLILAEFPPVCGYAALSDSRILDTFAQLQNATRGVRELRQSCDVSPKDKVAVTVVVPADHLQAFKAQAHIVQHMANIGTLNLVSQAKRPKNAGSITVSGLRIYIHDVSDDEAERKRATKSLEQLEKQIAGKEKKLANEKFVANANPEVVEADRQRLTGLVAQRDSLKAHLTELSTG